MKSLCIVINARSKSTRVPNKLLRKFANSSLIEIALQKLNKIDFIEKKYLATSEEEFSKLLVNYKNVNLLERNNEATLRGVNPLHVTFKHFAEVETDYILSLNPCLPFVSINTIKQVYEYFQSTDYNSYTASIKTGAWIFDDEGNPLTVLDPKNVTTNKDISFKKGAHAFHIISRQYFQKTKTLWSFTKDDPHLISMDEDEAIDIDTIHEFNFAEMLYLKATK